MNMEKELTERLVDGQISFDDEHGCTGDLHLLEDVASASVEHSVDTTNRHLRTLDLTEVDWLHETRLSCQQTGVQATSGCRDDLTTTSVDGVGV